MRSDPTDTAGSPARRPFKVWALFAGFLGGGIGSVWLALDGLIGSVHEVASLAPLIVLSPIDARALFAGLALLVFAAMLLLPVPEWARGGPRRRRRKNEAVPRDWAVPFMGVAMLCLLLCAVAPLVTALAMEEVAAARGYRRCAPPDDERRPPLRWARIGSENRCRAVKIGEH